MVRHAAPNRQRRDETIPSAGGEGTMGDRGSETGTNKMLNVAYVRSVGACGQVSNHKSKNQKHRGIDTWSYVSTSC